MRSVGRPTRRSLLIAAVGVLAGCGGNGDGGSTDTATATPSPTATGTTSTGALTLASPAFADGERIPETYGYEAENVNPPLEVSAVPTTAETLALIVDDPDAVDPAGEVWDHWVVWNVPAGTRSIPEDWTPDQATEGTNDYDEVGYGGPNPPDAEHTYRFLLFALDTRLDLAPSTDADGLREAMEGSILAKGRLEGTYPP